jgi:hypothetical protein
MTYQVYFEVPIVILSLSLWVSKLSQVYGAFVADVEVETSLFFFMLQLLLSTLWIICATLTRQWLVLITTCNGFLCQTFIIYYLYKTKQRNHERYRFGFVKVGYLSCEDACAMNAHHDLHGGVMHAHHEKHNPTHNAGVKKHTPRPEHVLASKVCPLGLLH